MGKLTNGLLLGLGISLLVAPKTGKEMRQLVAERFSSLHGIPPAKEEPRQSVAQPTERVPEVQQQTAPTVPMGSTAYSSAQQTATGAGPVQEDLGSLAQQGGTNVPSTPYDDTVRLNPNQPNRPLP